jgi:hypothetical protein
MTKDRAPCRTPNPDKPGVTRIPRWKYDLMRGAIRAVLAEAPADGFPFRDLAGAVEARLSAEDVQRLGSVKWHSTTVKLEMEVAGEVSRVPGAVPQRLVLTPGRA